MELSDIRQRLGDQLGLSIEPAMCNYILSVLSSADAEQKSPLTSIPVIGADARTGIALRRVVPVALFNAVHP